ncbi:MAG: cyclic nucleotide-binding domain-containing protein [Nitrospinae bacterium]|nr:cyclic nucleotide-binding domain-containing protein [Nitrospinota bacterium]
MIRSLETILTQSQFLQGLKKEHLELLTGCASNVRFNAGDYIFREGEEANQFFLIRQGRVSLELNSPNKGPIIIQTLSEGDIAGWSWLIPPYRWMFDGRAMELTRAIALDGKCLRTKCEADHDLGYELFKRFSHILWDSLHAANIQLLDLYGGAKAMKA